MNYSFLDFLVIGSCLILPEIIFDLTYRRIAKKKASYNCENCKLWDCPAHECAQKRNNLIKKD